MIAGKHKCGKELDMRMLDVKDGDKNIVAWVIYGVCKRCSLVLVSDIFTQKEEPIQGPDFIIDYTKVSQEAGAGQIEDFD